MTDPIHPGEHLLKPSESSINEIVLERRSVTADTALRIGKALGTTPEFWLNLQGAYDLDHARNSVSTASIESLVAA